MYSQILVYIDKYLFPYLGVGHSIEQCITNAAILEKSTSWKYGPFMKPYIKCNNIEEYKIIELWKSGEWMVVYIEM